MRCTRDTSLKSKESTTSIPISTVTNLLKFIDGFTFILSLYLRSNLSFKHCQLLRQLLQLMHRYVQVKQPPSLQIRHQTVYPQLLPLFPSLLHKRCTGHIKHLLLHIYLHQQLRLFFYSRQMSKSMRMFMPYSSQFGQPSFQRTMVVLSHCSLDSSASIMSRHNDILHSKYLYCILNDCQ